MKAFIYSLSIITLFSKGANAFESVHKYEQYLNGIKTLSGDFTQVNSKGHSITGKIEMSRPGKMRLTYNPPSNLLIIANGKWLITIDRKADEVDYVSLENTPAAFILQPYIQFKGDVEVTTFIPKGETTEISLVRKEEPDAGYLTLVFKENPIALKEWSIIDAQGVETRVILSNTRSNINLAPELFMIKNPNWIQQIF